MAERIVSPGVFTRERDLSYLQQGVGAIGAAVIGPVQKGPALVPITCNGINDFYAKCGFSSTKTYVPRTVESYLRSAGGVTVVRVLGGEGWTTTVYTLDLNGTPSQSMAVFANTNGNNSVPTILGANTAASFVISASGGTYSCSLNPTSANYITKVFGTDPHGSKAIYVILYNKNLISASYSATPTGVVQLNSSAYVIPAGFTHATTPWIQSQTISGRKYDLFKFHMIGDGNISNIEKKIGIQDVKVGTIATDYYGSFTVIVRNVNGTFGSQDLDRRPEVIETFSNLSLDPNASNYIAKMIGDRYTSNQVVDGANRVISSGSYANNSMYIRVEMDPYSDALPPEAVPYGFASLTLPVSSSAVYPSASMIITQSIDGAYDARKFYGFDFEYSDNLNYLNPVPNGSVAGNNISFSLDDITVPSDLSGAPYIGTMANVTGTLAQRKFIVPFVGGFDGMAPTQSINVGGDITAANVFGYNCSTATATGTLQYKKALDAVSNAEEIDINLLVTPGIMHGLHTQVTTYAKNVCETRGDAFYIMDASQYSDTPLTIINNITDNELDSNYVAVYYPWLKVVESSTNRTVWMPASVLLPGVYAFNDQVAYEWFAPAGLNRGGLTEALEAKTKLTQTQRDDLYSARINPIATFPGQGVVVWGQKTLQIKPSALDRVNVRRLLINLKKFCASTSRYLVFEQNNSATRNRFLNIVNPYLSSVQQKAGLYAFKVVMDETNNTPDIIDRNILYGQIYLQPTKTAEFIVLDFNILPTGATFTTA